MKKCILISLFIVAGSVYAAEEQTSYKNYQLARTMYDKDSVIAVAALTRNILSSSANFSNSTNNNADDHIIKEWDIETGQVAKTYHGHMDSVTTIMALNNLIASGSADKTIKLWDINSNHLIATLQGHTSMVKKVIADTNPEQLISGSMDGTVKIWDIRIHKFCNSFENKNNQVFSVAVNKNSIVAGTSGNNSKIPVLDKTTGECNLLLSGHAPYKITFSVCVDPVTGFIFSGSGDKTIKMWNPDSGLCMKTLIGHTYMVNAVTTTGTEIISAAQDPDCTVRVWDKESGMALQILQGHSRTISSIATQPNCIISGSYDKSIKIWRK